MKHKVIAIFILCSLIFTALMTVSITTFAQTEEKIKPKEPPEIKKEKTPPVADAGEDQVVCINSSGKTNVILDGSGSIPSKEGNPLEYHWYYNNKLLIKSDKPVIKVKLEGPRIYQISLIVRDRKTGLESKPDYTTVDITKGRPPKIDLNVLTNELWPPNHKMQLVAVVSASAADDCCDKIALIVRSKYFWRWKHFF